MEIPFINIAAKNNYEFGFKLGSALSERINKRIETNKKMYRRKGVKDFSSLVDEAKKFLPGMKKYFPNLLIEAQAMSEGAGVDFDEILVRLCGEELLSFSVPKCTSISVKTTTGDVLLGHNEDWLSEYRRNGLAIVRGEIGKKKFLSLGYIGHLPGTSCGINNYGLAYTGNSLESEGLNYGVPRNILLRSLLEAKTIEEAERIATYRKRSICFNTMLVKNSTMLDIESLWKSHEVFYGEDWIVHTNHPLKEAYQNSKNTHEESVERQCEAEKYFSNEQNYSLDALKKILKSHKTGICTHKNIHHSTYGVTIASVIMNPSKGWMEVCHSNPCKHGYKLYKL